MQSRLASVLASLILLLAPLAGCSDDEPSSETDTGSPDTGGGDAADQGDDSADLDDDGDAGGDDPGVDTVSDTEDEVVDRVCGRPPAQDETVTYDVLSPLAEFVGEAEVSRAGLDVSVVIPDPDDPENPTTFEGAFEAGTRCVAAVYEEINANLCFFNPDGSPAEAETLGAQIFAFIQGGPTGTPNPTLLGGVRRELDLSCSVAGFYALDTSGLTERGDLPTGVAQTVRDEALAYLALFEGGDGRVDTAMSDPPVVEPALAADVETGAIEVEMTLGLVIDVADTPTEFDVAIAFDGSVSLAQNTVGGEMMVTITGDDASGSLSGGVTGVRQ